MMVPDTGVAMCTAKEPQPCLQGPLRRLHFECILASSAHFISAISYYIHIKQGLLRTAQTIGCALPPAAGAAGGGPKLNGGRTSVRGGAGAQLGVCACR